MRLVTISVIAVLASASCVEAENWGQWRGPAFNGSSPESNLPDDFSPTKNVAWTVPLPGESAATPIVWGDRVFISSSNEKDKTLRAICLDKKTGKVIWDQEV